MEIQVQAHQEVEKVDRMANSFSLKCYYAAVLISYESLDLCPFTVHLKF